MRRAFVLACACVLAACKPDPAPPAPAASTTSAPLTRVVTVDSSLTKDGRIVVDAIVVRSASGQATIPGVVDSAEAGAAAVTSLVAGRVATLTAKVGDAVAKGQVLGTLDSPDAGRAQADMLRARGRAVLASRALARQLELEAQEATSKAAIDQARAEDQAAKADVAAARAVLGSIGAPEPGEGGGASSAIALRAPIAGVIVERTAVLGGPVAENAVLFRVVASDRVVVVARLPETSPIHPSPGDEVTVTPRRAPELACAGTIERVVPWVDDSRTRTVRVTPSDGCKLVPGAFVEVRLRDRSTADAGAGIFVPTAAVVEVHGITSVFVAGTKEGSFTLRPVRVSATSGDDTEILTGVTAGERVVTAGALLLKGELLRQELE